MAEFIHMDSQVTANFLFCGTGTKGDLYPLITLARAMQEKGHRCHVLGNCGVEQFARRFGVAYTAVAAEQTNNLVSVEENFSKHLFPSYAKTLELIESEVHRRSKVVVVNLDNYSASNLACERFGLPLVRLHLAPYKLRSNIDPPAPYRCLSRGVLGSSFLRYTLPLIYKSWDSAPYIIREINKKREGFGLKEIGSLSSVTELVSQHIGLFPEWYRARSKDWPANLLLTGFPLFEAKNPTSEVLELFLRNHSQPIVFTPGTGCTNVDGFFAAARICCRKLGVNGIFLSPHAKRNTSQPEIAVFDYLDLATVLPRASLLVHHGGIGTTARALEAGVPQVICPMAYDQPDNAELVAALGVGRIIDSSAETEDFLTKACRELLCSAEVKNRAKKLAASVHAGADVAATVAGILSVSA